MKDQYVRKQPLNLYIGRVRHSSVIELGVYILRRIICAGRGQDSVQELKGKYSVKDVVPNLT
jgi:hypothetical protein